MTARELAEALLALPDPDTPVFCWAPGQYWELESPHRMRRSDGAEWIMVELNQIEQADAWAAAIGGSA